MELVLLVLGWIALGVATIAVVTGGSFTMEGIQTAQQDASMVGIIVLLVVRTLTSVVWGVCHASLFVELRNAKDGPSDASLAEVFR